MHLRPEGAAATRRWEHVGQQTCMLSGIYRVSCASQLRCNGEGIATNRSGQVWAHMQAQAQPDALQEEVHLHEAQRYAS